jgi:hypothetical protein
VSDPRRVLLRRVRWLDDSFPLPRVHDLHTIVIDRTGAINAVLLAAFLFGLPGSVGHGAE